MSFFISDAIAASSAPAPAGGEPMSMMLLMAGVIAMFYFMLIRPQNKRAKEHRDLVGSLQKGDEVVTAGGMLGKVVRVGDNYLKLSIAEGIEINVQRASVSSVLPKGTIKSI